ncbi:antibiotic biosynthesis monooxygenase [Nitratireductor sp. XY-223]|uniref:putative quinol monooxygenase n=1 Tax=Nitratireductor sp. XY-223 TaxID=2561926 RepID=UPI00145AC81A|nr:antibiotic biosynthesis monooxygenase [Nitratireductor sp. XY-223]
MTATVGWFIEAEIKEGQRDSLKELIVEMSDRSENNEPGTLVYEWSISEDGTTGHLYERYADSEAALTHLASFGENFADRFMPLVGTLRMSVYGAPSAALRKELAGMEPRFFERAGGFAR